MTMSRWKDAWQKRDREWNDIVGKGEIDVTGSCNFSLDPTVVDESMMPRRRELILRYLPQIHNVSRWAAAYRKRRTSCSGQI